MPATGRRRDFVPKGRLRSSLCHKRAIALPGIYLAYRAELRLARDNLRWLSANRAGPVVRPIEADPVSSHCKDETFALDLKKARRGTGVSIVPLQSCCINRTLAA